MIDIHHDTFVQTIGYTTPSMNPKGNYGLCVIVMCQCKFILGLKKKSTTLLSNDDNEEALHVQGQGTYEKSVSLGK